MAAQSDDSEEDGAPALRIAAVQPAAQWRIVAPAPVPFRDIDQAGVASLRDEPRRTEQSVSAPRGERTPSQLGWAKRPEPPQQGRGAKSPGTTSPPKARAGAEATASSGASGESEHEAANGRDKRWIIQIGATDDAAKANALLDSARKRSRSILASAKPVTEKVRKGEDTFYRARFAGLDSASAESACRSLKRDGFSCFAARD